MRRGTIISHLFLEFKSFFDKFLKIFEGKLVYEKEEGKIEQK